MKANVLGVGIDALTKEKALERFEELTHGKRSYICKVNAEFLVNAKRGDDFRDILNHSALNIADGTGVLWAARFLTLRTTHLPVLRQLQILWQAKYSLLSLIFYSKFCRYPIPERIPGVESFYLMLEAAIETGSSVFFLGAAEDVNKKAQAEMLKKYPNLLIAGGRGGYWKDDREVVEQIKKSDAKLLIVALGSPKQEYWIRGHLSELKTVRVAVGEGGTLDFIAGSFKRAPRWMQKIGLEWLWRLFMNKSKSSTGSRARRIWNAVPVFIYEVVKWKIVNGGTPVDSSR